MENENPKINIYYDGNITTTAIYSPDCTEMSQRHLLSIYERLKRELTKKRLPKFMVVNMVGSNYKMTRVSSIIMHLDKVTHITIENITNKNVVEEWAKQNKNK